MATFPRDPPAGRALDGPDPAGFHENWTTEGTALAPCECYVSTGQPISLHYPLPEGGRTSHGLTADRRQRRWQCPASRDGELTTTREDTSDNMALRPFRRRSNISRPSPPRQRGRRCRRRMRGRFGSERTLPPHRAVPTTSPTYREPRAQQRGKRSTFRPRKGCRSPSLG
jgi:hypothetical protein